MATRTREGAAPTSGRGNQRLRGWRVVLAGAALFALAAGPALAQFGKNKIAYREFDWRIYHSPHFDVYYYPESEAQLQKVVSFAESAYDVLSREFDFQIKEPTPLIFYATHSAFEQNNIILNFIPEGIGAFASPVRNRMVMPVDMPDPELLELIAHELTHIFQYHILYQGRLSRAVTSQPPQWLMEGMASYMAEDEGARERMFLRDAVVNDAVPRIAQRGTSGFFAYRFGHAVFDFIEERWGKDGFRDFVYEYRNSFGSRVDRALEKSFRVKSEDFDVEFRRWLRRRYLPELARTGEPLDFGRPFRVGEGDRERNALAASPAASPSGDLVAAFSTVSDDLDVVLFDAKKREMVRNLTKGYSSEYQYLVAQEVGALPRKSGADLAFSPDGNSLAVFAKKEHGRTLLLLDVLKGGIQRTLATADVEQQVGLSWRPDGQAIAFAGVRNGRFDIYEIDLGSGAVRNLTDDDIYDSAPTYAPDGKSIVISSVAGTYAKLFRLNLEPGAVRRPLTTGDWNDKEAAFSIDGKRLYFASDRGDAQNIWAVDLESGKEWRVTNAVTGCYQPAVLPQADGSERVVFTGYWKGRFDLYLVDDAILEQALQPDAAMAVIAPPAADEAVKPEAPAIAGDLPRFEPDIQVTIDEENKEEYGGFKLFVEDVGATVGVNSDQTFISDTYISFTDYLGDRRLIARFSSIESFSNFDVSYWNLKKRTQWGVNVFDNRTFFLGQDFNTGQIRRGRAAIKQTGVLGSVAYPFSLYHRFEVDGGYVLRDIDYQSFVFDEDTDAIVPVVLPRKDDFPMVAFSFVGDTTLYNEYGPIKGRRYRLSASYAPDFDKENTLRLDGKVSGTLASTLRLDFRQYVPISRRSLFAIRAVASTSYGNFPEPLYFGGLDTLRGTDFRDLVGDRAFFVNVEYRFPLFDYLIGPFLNFRGIGGRIFLDVGGAWFDYANEEFEFWNSDESRLADAVSSYGWGFTINFGGLDLNWDFAKRWDFKESLDKGLETSFWIGTKF